MDNRGGIPELYIEVMKKVKKSTFGENDQNMARPTSRFLIAALCGLVILVSCKKEVKVSEVPPITPVVTEPDSKITINSTYQATGTMDGNNFNFTNGKNAFYTSVAGYSAINPAPGNSSEVFGSRLSKGINGEGFELRKGTRKFVDQEAYAKNTYLAYFSKGSKSFAQQALSEMQVDGMELTYKTGSTITITDIRDVSTATKYKVLILVKIKCNLYAVNGSAPSKMVDMTLLLPIETN